MTQIGCNLHTHTSFCDGADEPDIIVKRAIEQGMSTLGFSSHSPTTVPNDYGFVKKEELPKYRKTVRDLKELYKDKIEILLGIERDFFSAESDDKYDFVIGSVHYIYKDRFIPMDISPQALQQGINESFAGDAISLAKCYYETVAQLPKQTKCNIIGHLDIVTKYNEICPYIDEDSREYQKAALEALEALVEQDMLIEVNTGAMLKGYKKQPYPAPFIVKRLSQLGGRMILSSDCHQASALMGGFGDAVEYMQACGAHKLCIYQDGKPKEINI